MNFAERGMNIRKYIRYPIIIAGVALSIVIASILCLTGIGIVESLLIALLGIVISLQVDQIARFKRIQLTRERHSDLLGKMERVEWLSPLIGDVVNYVNKIYHDHRNDHFTLSAKFHVDKCKRYLQNLSDGHMSIRFDDQELLMTSLNATQKHMRAVSVIRTVNDFWISSSGRRYWNANLQAIARRSVRIERIFIYDIMTDALLEVAQTAK